jgi:hypothetical protein
VADASGSGPRTELSQHPVDRLIRDLIRPGREASAEEVDLIVERIASAPFDSRLVAVSTELRGVTYRGRTLKSRDESLVLHLVRRVLVDAEWAHGTTEQEYEVDLRRAVRDPSGRLVIYARRGGHIAAVFAPNTVPAARRGPAAKPWLFVVFAADRGILLTGHQVSRFPAHRVPEDVRWLT